jgi:hypothetical protein
MAHKLLRQLLDHSISSLGWDYRPTAAGRAVRNSPDCVHWSAHHMASSSGSSSTVTSPLSRYAHAPLATEDNVNDEEIVVNLYQRGADIGGIGASKGSKSPTSNGSMANGIVRPMQLMRTSSDIELSVINFNDDSPSIWTRLSSCCGCFSQYSSHNGETQSISPRR